MVLSDPSQEPQSRSTLSVWIGVLLLFAFFGLLAFVVIGASPRGDTYEQRRAKIREEKLKTARDEATKTLTSYGWVNKDKGVARIPIDEAMKLTVAELSQKKPMPGNPIATPAVNPPAQNASPNSGATTQSPTAAPGGAPKVAGPNATPQTPPAAKPSPGASPNQPVASPPPSATPNLPPAASPSTSAPGTPLPIRGKTP